MLIECDFSDKFRCSRLVEEIPCRIPSVCSNSLLESPKQSLDKRKKQNHDSLIPYISMAEMS